MYYKICDKCGAWLDVGEQCDCSDNSDHVISSGHSAKGLQIKTFYEEDIKKKGLSYARQ